MNARNIWVYDLEIFPNFFSCVAMNIDSGQVISFVLHKNGRNDLNALYSWLTSEGLVMIGYNNLEFDYQLLHVILKLINTNNVDTYNINALIDAIRDRTRLITSDAHHFAKKLIPEWKMLITQIDLYKIAHYDNTAKATSLKWLEFGLRMENVQDLPLHFLDEVTEDQVEDILKYNYNDVLATYNFFNYQNSYGKYAMRDAVALRASISNEYGLSVMNANDVKIGVSIFAKQLASNMGISNKRLKDMRTPRPFINIGDCVLDYVRFASPHFNSLLTFLGSQEITQTKGAFSNIPVQRLGQLNHYCAKSETKFENGKFKNKKLVKKGELTKLNVLYKGFQYDFGTGGIHGCIAPGVYIANDGYVIIDIDVASYYPNLAIKNGFKPEHLGESFCRVYEDIYKKRRTYPKSNPNNAALKLALNGTYGKSNSEHSFLYDPKFTMDITINGQLLLCMLAEKLVDKIDNCTMLQINTDGMTIRVKEEMRETVMKICGQWERLTQLTLEYVDYERMIIRDVNNYIGVYGAGKYKHKGMFEIDKDLHKNPSRRVGAIALHNYFIHGVPIAQTIRNHAQGVNHGTDNYANYGIYDYLIAKKANRGWLYQTRKVDFEGNIVRSNLDGKIIRYFVSNTGYIVSKMDKSKLDTDGYNGENVEVHPQKGKSYYITVFNQYFKSDIYDIDYSYYIKECNKTVNTIEQFNQTSLF